MSRVLAELDAHTSHVLVHSGQNSDYELNQVFFDQLGLRPPDHVLDAVGESLAETIARIIERSDAVMEREQPDARRALRRHQHVPVGDPGQAAEDPGLPPGGGQPLLRRARARGDQPPARRPPERHQHAAHGARPALPARRGAPSRRP